MAVMIPDRMPKDARQGEKNAFVLLQKLPDDCVCYFEPVIGERYPDFVVILPELGVLIIEVKDWHLSTIVKADNRDVTTNRKGRIETQTHPVRQAIGYMHELMNTCRRSRHASRLVNQEGRHEGRFAFPFGHVVFMSNIRREQIDRIDADLAASMFAENKVVMRDEIESLLEGSAGSLIEKMRRWFNPSWPFPRLTKLQVDLIRSIIHPEILIGGRSVAVLDHKQEGRARSIGHGHRLIYGVAGSGKTVILIARAKMLAKEGRQRVLMLCFNRELARQFRESVRDYTTVEAMTFHAWAHRNRALAPGDPGGDHEAVGRALLARLEARQGDANGFDAVLVDEAQDFHPLWFTCAKQALKQPDDGDFLIALDGGQNLYGRKTFTWKSVGVNATGRVLSRKGYDLDFNYRNTRQILTVAARFAAVNESGGDDDALRSFRIDPTFTVREGPPPGCFAAENRADEMRAVVNTVEGWLKTGVSTNDGDREEIEPCDIAILFPRSKGFEKPLATLCEKLGALAPVRLVSAAAPSSGARDANAPGSSLTVGTIHSSKGLQYRAVILIWTDLLVAADNPDRHMLDRALLYVGMTRAQTFLCMTWARTTPVTSEIEAAIASLDEDDPAESGAVEEPVSAVVPSKGEQRAEGPFARLFRWRR